MSADGSIPRYYIESVLYTFDLGMERRRVRESVEILNENITSFLE